MNDKLLQIAKDFLEEKTSHVIYACVGGSVGNGNADEYSDIDLTVYTNTEIVSEDIDFFYKDHIIQLEILHIKDLPNQQGIKSSPWDFRFLPEITIIKDNEDNFDKIKKWATDFLNSVNGRKIIFEQVSNIIIKRQKSALEYLEQQRFYSATIAAIGAWSEAGFLYLFFNYNTSSNGHLIPKIQGLNLHFEKFKRVSPFYLKNVSAVSKILAEYRDYLRRKDYDSSGLTEIHDVLCDGKAQRLSNKQEDFNLIFQMYSEALWLYFETSNGQSFENYFNNLPVELQKGLSKLGFVPLEEKNIKEICRLSNELWGYC